MYIRSALQSIWSHKVRSLLTVLGVVIGVSSVTTLIALGQGLKNDVSGLIQGFGTNVIVVLSGSVDTETQGNINPANIISGDILTMEDVESIREVAGVKTLTPLALVGGLLQHNDLTAAPLVYGAYASILEAFEVIELEEGAIFNDDTAGDVIVLGPDPRESLFGERAAIDEEVIIADRSLDVVGVLSKSKSTSIFGSEFDNMAIIPFDTATSINGEERIFRIVIKADDDADVTAVRDAIHATILENHDGQEDFSVLTQDDLLDLFNQFLNLSTALVSAIAAISLIVGGIGIMNIMLVTVTERTKEIGLRKAVGATRFAILVQFLVEAIVVTLLGGVIGLAISLGASYVVSTQTELQPDITPEIVLTAVGISTLIGVIFGIWPAYRAANKDPIEALRSE